MANTRLSNILNLSVCNWCQPLDNIVLLFSLYEGYHVRDAQTLVQFQL